ncbi:hypothetical protein TOC8171_16190 [Pseudomonas syringae]
MRKTLIALMFATALPAIAMAAPPAPPAGALMQTHPACTCSVVTEALVCTVAQARSKSWT